MCTNKGKADAQIGVGRNHSPTEGRKEGGGRRVALMAQQDGNLVDHLNPRLTANPCA